MPDSKVIALRGAREHNLKNIDIDIPRNRLVVLTGLSGSGKSSLAFDTIYAEGQRRYVESLSAYARQFLQMMGKPDIDHITGLSPAISIEQKTTSRNPRSTVGTVTEIQDYLRLLFARVGTPFSPATGLPIEAQTISQMVDRIMGLRESTRLYLLAPVVRDRKGEFRKEMAEWRRQGYQRLKIDGAICEMEEAPALDRKYRHDIDVVVDRLVIREGIETRLADSLQSALALTEGIAAIETLPAKRKEKPERMIFSEKFACPVSGFSIPEIEPRLFSFNAPSGACPACDGLGVERILDERLIVPAPDLSLHKGAIAPWARSTSAYLHQTMTALAYHFGFSLHTPWRRLPERVRKIILHGSGEEKIPFRYDDGERSYNVRRVFEGVIPNLARRYRETDSPSVREDVERYQAAHPCSACSGHRLRPEALCVRVNGAHIGEVSELSITGALAWVKDTSGVLRGKHADIAAPILKEIRDRLRFLENVGLDYLTLSRSSGTLSGGESQRIRLASQIGSGLTGVLYVLDEPSIGLHQRDNARLLRTLVDLRDQGNSVLVVEHDEEAILAADHVIDMGPGAGEHGGRIVAQGTSAQIMGHASSLTGAYLAGKRTIPVPDRRRKGKGRDMRICVLGARGNNLKSVDLALPLGCFVCVTGVSGGGKSTLIVDTLYKAAARALSRTRTDPAPYDRIEGLEFIDKVIDIDQSPIGRTPRSNPATYTGAFAPIRDWFSGLPESRARGYKAGRFSFNVKGGRCEACQGDGVMRVEMHFLSDIYVECDVCRGKRYNRETLAIKFRDKSIADILDMTIEEGVTFFGAVPAIRDKLMTLERVGLGYVRIGQRATTLSGGEAQRVKLSKELARRATRDTLYILDEPTTGLHFEDVRRLLEVLHELVDQGNTVVVIEHNLDVIKTADWVIDLGPEGGDGGGEIIASGTPEQIAAIAGSHTGGYLRKILNRKARRAAG